MSENSPKLIKAQRLALAAAVAPSLRKTAQVAGRRRVTRVDGDGNVVGYTTLGEVQAALLKKHGVEISVAEETNKEWVCIRCGVQERGVSADPYTAICRRCYRTGVQRRAEEVAARLKIHEPAEWVARVVGAVVGDKM